VESETIQRMGPPWVTLVSRRDVPVRHIWDSEDRPMWLARTAVLPVLPPASHTQRAGHAHICWSTPKQLHAGKHTLLFRVEESQSLGRGAAHAGQQDVDGGALGGRVPFLDQLRVGLAFVIPDQFKLEPELRGVLREATVDTLLRSVLVRPRSALGCQSSSGLVHRRPMSLLVTSIPSCSTWDGIWTRWRIEGRSVA
jgi:hypothetical protein